PSGSRRSSASRSPARARTLTSPRSPSRPSSPTTSRPAATRARRRCRVTAEFEAGRAAVRPVLALYVGGMGTYYNRLVVRYGYEAEAAAIRELYLGGKQRDAGAAVPDALVDELCLVGTRERIADRLGAGRESGVTTLLVQTRERETLRTMAELLL